MTYSCSWRSFCQLFDKVNNILQEFHFCDSPKQLSFCFTYSNVILFFLISNRWAERHPPDLLLLVSSQGAKSLSVKVSYIHSSKLQICLLLQILETYTRCPRCLWLWRSVLPFEVKAFLLEWGLQKIFFSGLLSRVARIPKFLWPRFQRTWVAWFLSWQRGCYMSNFAL